MGSRLRRTSPIRKAGQVKLWLCSARVTAEKKGVYADTPDLVTRRMEKTVSFLVVAETEEDARTVAGIVPDPMNLFGSTISGGVGLSVREIDPKHWDIYKTEHGPFQQARRYESRERDSSDAGFPGVEGPESS